MAIRTYIMVYLAVLLFSIESLLPVSSSSSSIVYVKQGAIGGNGTSSAFPLGSIQEGINASSLNGGKENKQTNEICLVEFNSSYYKEKSLLWMESILLVP